MAYLVLAKMVVAAHFGFVAFLFVGGLLLARHRWVAWIHAPCIAYAMLITVVGWSCPLTLLEQWLLETGGRATYVGEFLPHYVWSNFGLTGAEPAVAAGLILALVAANLRPYRAIVRVWVAAPRS